MPDSPPPAPVRPCKICGHDAPHFGRCDFHDNARLNFGFYSRAINKSGVMVDYHACPQCGFVFTPFMDHWTPRQFAQLVYTRDYARLDGSYNGARAGKLANILTLAFDGMLDRLRFLDYGGGPGITPALMRAFGAPDAHNYDPYASDAQRPQGRFNVVTCLEVLEHATDPRALAADLLDLVDWDNGFLFVGTEFQPPDMAEQKLGWWYVTPRVGHVSLFTASSFERLFAGRDLRFFHAAGNVHIVFRQWPAWAQGLFPTDVAGG